MANFACGIPNLESPACSEARVAAKQFYSFHFGNEMRPSAENLKARERFLTQAFYESLAAANESKTDIFTASEDPPTTFKIGECKVIDKTKTDIQVQIYWRDDAQTVQKEVHVETVKTGEDWLINKVGP
ncbi:MAG: hypothetical protein WBO10_13285 [Pyrinomonadaceae bacterium]